MNSNVDANGFVNCNITLNATLRWSAIVNVSVSSAGLIDVHVEVDLNMNANKRGCLFGRERRCACGCECERDCGRVRVCRGVAV